MRKQLSDLESKKYEISKKEFLKTAKMRIKIATVAPHVDAWIETSALNFASTLFS